MTRRVPSTPGISRPDLSDYSAKQCVAAWLDLFETGEVFLLAGLRHELGREGDLVSAYRQWYTQQMDQHDRMIARMAEVFCRQRGADDR